MKHINSFALLILPLFSVLRCFAAVPHERINGRSYEEVRDWYSKAHSLGDDYRFDPRHGWSTVNMTDLQYKYRNQNGGVEDNNGGNTYNPIKRSNRSKQVSSKKKAMNSPAKKIISLMPSKWKDLFVVAGKAEQVVVTWYAGEDLANPSCWASGSWAPSDQSFACALTLEGWIGRPQCFKFLELCNGSTKCVFVRVVDTCAGCAPGSKHVDLTRAAFGQLADFDEGILSVQMRPVSDPKEYWFENLWGPKH